MTLRLRLPELLDSAGLTPYALAKASGGRISQTAAHRLCRRRGEVLRFDADTIEALADVLGVEPGALLERIPAPRRKTR